MTRTVSTLAFALVLLAGGLGGKQTAVLAQQHAQGIGRRVIRKVAPQYPEIARRMNITGKVRLQLVIGSDGSVKVLRVLGGHPLLVKSAEDAVKNWKFETNSGASTQVVEIEFAGTKVR